MTLSNSSTWQCFSKSKPETAFKVKFHSDSSQVKHYQAHWITESDLAMFFHFKNWDSIQSRILLRFNQSQTLIKKEKKISCVHSKCTLAKILSILSVELLRYGIISLISSKMLSTSLIQLHNPPKIKFCAFYKVFHKIFKKLLDIKKMS